MNEFTIKLIMFLVLTAPLLKTLHLSHMLTAKGIDKMRSRGHFDEDHIYSSYMHSILKKTNEPNNLGNIIRRNETKLALQKIVSAKANNRLRGKVIVND